MKQLAPYLLFAIVLVGCSTSTIQMEYDKAGTPYAAWRYIDGVKQGKSILYNNNGDPYFEGHFENGQMQGVSHEYTFFDGKRELAIRYECQSDRCKGYLPQDNILVNEITFNDGLPHGAASYYYVTGERQKTVNFINGNRQGQQNEYYKEGPLKRTTTFVDDQMDGPQSSYAINGHLQHRSIVKPLGVYYVHLQNKEYNEHGTLQHETITNKQGTILFQRSYSSAGLLIKELDYKKKTTTIYDGSGNPTSEISWLK